MKDIFSAPGTYLLLLECDEAVEISTGRLGNMVTQPGYYLYVGSAFGPGGIQARVRHHRKTAARPHWHIDYLRSAAELMDAWCVYGLHCEHEWANGLIRSDTVIMPLKGFGSSDCDCAAHLFYFRRKPVKAELEKILNSKLASVKV